MENIQLYQTISLVTVFLLMIIWSLVWKALALWRAARNNNKPIFIAFLFLHTLGLFEIIYLYVTRKKKKEDVGGEMPKIM